MRVYPIINSIDNLDETYDKDGNKTLLLDKNVISKIFEQAKKDITEGKYKLFRISHNGSKEIIIVKKKSIHLKVLQKNIKKCENIGKAITYRL